MPFGGEPLVLTEPERQELQQMTQSRTLPAGDVMRARMILLLAEGVAYQKIQDLLHTTAPTIARWKHRFLEHRIAGLVEELHPGQQPSVRTPKLQAKVLSAIKCPPTLCRRPQARRLLLREDRSPLRATPSEKSVTTEITQPEIPVLPSKTALAWSTS
jgi:hypothetical protein